MIYENAFYDSNEVRSAANGRWVDILAHHGADSRLLRNTHGPCPGCGGRDRFRFDDNGGNGSFICSQGGGDLLAGDGFSLLMHMNTGWDWKRALRAVAEFCGVPPARTGYRPRQPQNPGVAAEPQSESANKRPELDTASVWEFTRGTPDLDAQWFKRRSRVDVESCDTTGFLGHLYQNDERVLVFVNEHSQGDFCAWVGRDMEGTQVRTFRMAQQKGVKSVPSALPAMGPKGVWFLTNPVTGTWAINPRAKVKGEDQPQWSRRSMESITSWRYFVLESDELPAPEWLKVLANLQMPIAAIYTSGGRSIHALVEYQVPTKAHWDLVRDQLRDLVCPLGADPGALSAVRLSRLPGCKRGERMQELLYLNPNPDSTPIRLLPALR